MPDAKRTQLFLTGEQLNKIHYLLLQERRRDANLDHDLLAAIYAALKRSGFPEEQRAKVQANLRKFLASQEGREWQRRYEGGRGSYE